MNLIEIHDHPRFPAMLRDLVTDALEALWAFGNCYKPILGRLREGLAASGESPAAVLDLCSGGGGPWLRLAEQLEREHGCAVSVCLTDKYPNREAMERVRRRLRAAPSREPAAAGDPPAAKDGRTRIDFAGSPVDALRIPAQMQGFRTIFSAFHHFDPAEAREILASAEESGRGIGIFEVARRGAKTMAVLCLTPFLVLWLTPFMRPFRWARLLWTYVLPAVPLVIWYDGWVSCLRAYSEAELREMVAGLGTDSRAGGCRWEVGVARSGLLPVTYVVGHPAGSGEQLAECGTQKAVDPICVHPTHPRKERGDGWGTQAVEAGHPTHPRKEREDGWGTQALEAGLNCAAAFIRYAYRVPMRGIRFLLIGVMATVLFGTAWAQGPVRSGLSGAALPDSPGAVASVLQAAAAGGEGSGRIDGTVLDINGSAVAGAAVTLVESGGPAAAERRAVSDLGGRFVFANLPPGRFKVTIASPGLETFVSAEIVLKAGEERELPQIALPIAAASMDVQVVVTQRELAQEEIAAEERQRVLGVLPNFYSSYIWNAAPLTGKQKFGLALRSITDPTEFLGAGIIAGVEQARNIHPGFGQDPAGYAQRFGAAYADDAIARMIGSAILPSILHQDPRYFYKGTGSKRSRVLYAMEMAVVKRGDDGRIEPNYSHIGGAFASGAISNAYYPAGDRGVGLTIANGLLNTAGNALDNIIREFALRRLTPSVPDYANGKP